LLGGIPSTKTRTVHLDRYRQSCIVHTKTHPRRRLATTHLENSAGHTDQIKDNMER
jgi:hypothetical protein